MLKQFGAGRPIRLFAAGMHGDEWKATSGILEKIAPPGTGTLLVMSSVSKDKYLSTLDGRYYTQYAPHLLEAIKTRQPGIYMELHAYSRENFTALTTDERFELHGVPAYIELESGILMGSVSPHIRKDYFTPSDLCVSFEMDKAPSNQSVGVIKALLDVIKECGSRDEFVAYMKKHYPEQAKIAIKNFRMFYGQLY